MPLLKEWKIGDHALAAIWKIEEPEAYFHERTGVQSDIKNDRRRTEHLAGRFLLTHLKEDFPVLQIQKDEHDKPRLGNNDYFFSISHSWPYVAAVIDPYEEAGIDIQTWHPRIGIMKHKFLSEQEQAMFTDDQLLVTAWSAKEAVYKWNGKRGVEFIEQIPIDAHTNNELTILFNSIERRAKIFVENIITTDFTCCYVNKVTLQLQ
ncbi:MAG: 4'-phosphopantetheinyl transferase superfamily protein [Bacteroidota bacterium]